MITPFGKYLRKLRIDHDEKLKDMAAKLGVTGSYLSAVEIGKRDSTLKLVWDIGKVYNLQDSEIDELELIASHSKSKFVIKLSSESSELKREVAHLLSTLMDEILEEEELQRIKNIIDGKE